MHLTCQDAQKIALEGVAKSAAHGLRITETVRCAILARSSAKKTGRRSWEAPPVCFPGSGLTYLDEQHVSAAASKPPQVCFVTSLPVAFCAPVRTIVVLQTLQAWLSTKTVLVLSFASCVTAGVSSALHAGQVWPFAGVAFSLKSDAAGRRISSAPRFTMTSPAFNKGVRAAIAAMIRTELILEIFITTHFLVSIFTSLTNCFRTWDRTQFRKQFVSEVKIETRK